MFRQLPFGSCAAHAPSHVDTNDQPTLVAGLGHRFAREVPAPNKNFLSRLKSYVKKTIAELLVPLATEPSFDEWIQNTPYSMERKAELIEIYQSLHGQPPSRKHRRKIKSFAKSESYPSFKHARWINSRSDHFKAWSGPWFKAIEEQVFKLPWFIKHIPVPDRAELIAGLKASGNRYFATDHTAFEAHMIPEVMEAVENVVYAHCLVNFPEVARIICQTLVEENHGATRRGVQFRIKGRRMSGDMCTSLGNGLTNWLVWSFLCKENGASWKGYVEGDDGIFAVSSGVPPTAEQYKALGFEIKIEEGADPCTMSFCGLIAADGQNIRSPSEFLSSFGWTSSTLYASEKIMASLLRAKALSAAYENPHCPILRAIADRALFLTQNSVPRFVQDGYHKLPENDAPKFQPTELTRDLFACLYGVSPIEQQVLEQRISTADSLDFLADVFPATVDVQHFSDLFIEIG